MDWFQQGGPVMWILLACSVTAVAVLVERVWFFVATKERPDQLMQTASEALQEHKFTSASWDIRSARGPIGSLVKESLAIASEGDTADRASVGRRLERRAREYVAHLETGIKPLEVVALIAPLLGLLGTIMGITKSLNAIGISSATARAQLLGQGLGEALIGTEFGLIIAVPATIAHAYLSRRLDQTAEKMEQVSGELQDMLVKPAAPVAEITTVRR